MQFNRSSFYPSVLRDWGVFFFSPPWRNTTTVLELVEYYGEITMNYDMIQSTLTLVIEAAVCSLPIIWLHYLYSSGRCPTTVRELSESKVVGVRKNFVEHLLEHPIQIPDFQPLSREAAHEREQDSDKLSDTFHSDSEDIAVEHLSNSERISSDIYTLPPMIKCLSQTKWYMLHGYHVVKISDLKGRIQLPAEVKRYRLRSQAVVRVEDLIAAQ